MWDKIKNKVYEIWHGHPFLLSEEVDIICEVRSDIRYIHLSDSAIKKIVKLRADKMYDEYKKGNK